MLSHPKILKERIGNSTTYTEAKNCTWPLYMWLRMRVFTFTGVSAKGSVGSGGLGGSGH